LGIKTYLSLGKRNEEEEEKATKMGKNNTNSEA
jgi:hypothetical protein